MSLQQKVFNFCAKRIKGRTFIRGGLCWHTTHYVHANFRCFSIDSFGDRAPQSGKIKSFPSLSFKNNWSDFNENWHGPASHKNKAAHRIWSSSRLRGGREKDDRYRRRLNFLVTTEKMTKIVLLHTPNLISLALVVSEIAN